MADSTEGTLAEEETDFISEKECIESSSAVGLIKVKVNWRQFAGEMVAPPRTGEGPISNNPVHEKSKKLTTHRVVLGVLGNLILRYCLIFKQIVPS